MKGHVARTHANFALRQPHETTRQYLQRQALAARAVNQGLPPRAHNSTHMYTFTARKFVIVDDTNTRREQLVRCTTCKLIFANRDHLDAHTPCPSNNDTATPSKTDSVDAHSSDNGTIMYGLDVTLCILLQTIADCHHTVVDAH